MTQPNGYPKFTPPENRQPDNAATLETQLSIWRTSRQPISADAAEHIGSWWWRNSGASGWREYSRFTSNIITEGFVGQVQQEIQNHYSYLQVRGSDRQRFDGYALVTEDAHQLVRLHALLDYLLACSVQPFRVSVEVLPPPSPPPTGVNSFHLDYLDALVKYKDSLVRLSEAHHRAHKRRGMRTEAAVEEECRGNRSQIPACQAIASVEASSKLIFHRIQDYEARLSIPADPPPNPVIYHQTFYPVAEARLQLTVPVLLREYIEDRESWTQT